MLYVDFICFILQFFLLIEQTNSHGYLADPPARSSAWLFDDEFSKCCKHYNHAEMFCGGTYYQWVLHGGKCSICGEAYDAKPRLFGLGDSMYLGKIVRTYTQGSVIPVTVVLTANHQGLFEFRVCNIDNNPEKVDATQSCLDLNLLQVANGTTQHKIESTFSTVNIDVVLPANLTCKHCVFQWKYITGNSWGSSDGRSCLGCGKENEEFYGCSDISIVDPKDSKSKPVSTEVIRPNEYRKCTSAIIFSRQFDLTSLLESYCQSICSNDCSYEKNNNDTVIYNGCKSSCEKLCLCK